MLQNKFPYISRRLYITFFRSLSSPITRRVNVKSDKGLILLVVPVTTFCLGTWQVKRRQWKLNLIEEVNKKNKFPPVELPNDLAELSEMEYQHVHIKGKFDHSNELYIGPRKLLQNEVAGGNLFSSQPNNGYFVITPFHLIDKNFTILVNRGWVPKSKLEPSKRMKGQVTEVQDVIGVVRLPEKRPQFSGKRKEGTKLFFYRDVLKMVQLTGSLPVFVDADSNSTVNEGPIGGQTRISFRNDHLSYIITWYSLCAATLYMWYKKYFRRIKF